MAICVAGTPVLGSGDGAGVDVSVITTEPDAHACAAVGSDGFFQHEVAVFVMSVDTSAELTVAAKVTKGAVALTPNAP